MSWAVSVASFMVGAAFLAGMLIGSRHGALAAQHAQEALSATEALAQQQRDQAIELLALVTGPDAAVATFEKCREFYANDPRWK